MRAAVAAKDPLLRNDLRQLLRVGTLVALMRLPWWNPPRWQTLLSEVGVDVVSNEALDGFSALQSEHCCPTKPVLLVEESLWLS